MRTTVRDLDERVARLEWLAAWHARGMWIAAASALTAMITTGLIFEQTRVASRQAELQAAIVNTNLRVLVSKDPNERRPVLVVKVANLGAPVSVSKVAIDLGDRRRGRYHGWVPRDARRIFEKPVRLNRNDAVDFEITKIHAREMPSKHRGKVEGIVVELETGVVERVSSEDVVAFFQDL